MKCPKTVMGHAVTRYEALSGGDIGQAFRLFIDTGESFFCKQYHHDMIAEKEAAGLQELARCTALRIPRVIHAKGKTLILEYIQPQRPNKQFYARFGSAVAQLHRFSSQTFGFTHDNYIGATPQINTPEESWAFFFCEHRLAPQVKWAVSRGAGEALQRCFSAARSSIETLLSQVTEPPALLHGDLWGGNHCADEQGSPVLFDPAVYYGHREADLAMTSLFGQFPRAFYRAYEEHFPRDKNEAARRPIYQLYHILNHYNLFGGSYRTQALRVLQQFV
ncbi:fructosamine kinase family protein [Chitinivibrio alkaliphilus]|uniref:Fructosamine kinase n=1 Tax=Chitinivibrio alkaliphilus ACht1 TaxID=1313304 RepID=U7D8C4_9BACT|nr:fructosamine kinase family protein [Chitinivibrio alkaliphilus]ERP32198.1 fructosamine kinase [Chitinivibrio alkaliphilus ACht1]